VNGTTPYPDGTNVLDVERAGTAQEIQHIPRTISRLWAKMLAAVALMLLCAGLAGATLYCPDGCVCASNYVSEVVCDYGGNCPTGWTQMCGQPIGPIQCGNLISKDQCLSSSFCMWLVCPYDGPGRSSCISNTQLIPNACTAETPTASTPPPAPAQSAYYALVVCASVVATSSLVAALAFVIRSFRARRPHEETLLGDRALP
jgi:hypothetical protein